MNVAVIQKYAQEIEARLYPKLVSSEVSRITGTKFVFSSFLYEYLNVIDTKIVNEFKTGA